MLLTRKEQLQGTPKIKVQEKFKGNLSNDRLTIHEAEIWVLCLPSITIDPTLAPYRDKREPKNPPIGVHVIATVQTSAQNKLIST